MNDKGHGFVAGLCPVHVVVSMPGPDVPDWKGCVEDIPVCRDGRYFFTVSHSLVVLKNTRHPNILDPAQPHRPEDHHQKNGVRG